MQISKDIIESFYNRLIDKDLITKEDLNYGVDDNFNYNYLKLIESRFILLTKTNKTEEVEKLTSNLLAKAKSVFSTEIP
jgi:hypothetical protein